MALKGIRVLELEGIGPGPMAACILADFGADVVSISRVSNGKVASQNDPVSRGKRSIALDLKSPEGLATLKKMAEKADVFIEAFRPGVAEKMGCGPADLQAVNPGLIYGRMTGFGQGGDKYEKMAGHDANYLAVSGVLDFFRRGDERPFPPMNFAADYAGGAVMLAMGVLLSLLERGKSGKGQVVDAAMVDGANYIALPIHKLAQLNAFVPVRPDGHLDTSGSQLNQAPHWSEAYRCKPDPKNPDKVEYMSVQAIEPQFYKELLKGLGLENEQGMPKRGDTSSWPWMKARFAGIFLTKTRDEWADIFYGTDACCVPILTPTEAAAYPHNIKRGTFAPTPGRPGFHEPLPAPKLSRTPGHAPRPTAVPAGDTKTVLGEFGLSGEEVAVLLASGVAVEAKAKL